MALIQNCLLNAFVHLLYYADTLNAFAMSSHILPVDMGAQVLLDQYGSCPFFLSHGIISVEQLLILAAKCGLERFI